MKRLAFMFIAALLSLGLQTTLAQQSTLQIEKLLASAHHKATVDGDLKGAIEEYRAAATGADHNRALAAEALIGMAECYEKLGNAEARKIFERVLRDYADQKEAVAIARTRLDDANRQAAARGDRPVWTGPRVDGFGTVSPDGRFLTYTDWNTTGGLVLRELASGKERRLTSGSYADGDAGFSAISRDGRQVAYEWSPGKDRYELRVASLQGTGVPDSKRVLDLEDVKSIAPYDWSPDGKLLAVFIGRPDFTGQIGLVGVTDGALRVLKSVDWKGPTKIFFSPDGQYIAYDLRVGETTGERHIFVMAVDGSRETDVVGHASENVIMGWSPDGKYLLFASDRSGSIGLWAQPLDGAKAHGTPVLVKTDIGSTWSLGLTTSGTMYVWGGASPIYVDVASIDLAAGTITASPQGNLQRFIESRGRPDWSADGKHLAYSSCGPLGGGPCKLFVRSMETGQTRELRPNLQYFFFPRWSPDGRSFVAQGTDLKGRSGIYQIDAQTGSTAQSDKGVYQSSSDGTSLYVGRGDEHTLEIVRHDLVTDAERQVAHIGAYGRGFYGFSVSPDERLIAIMSMQKPGQGESLTVMQMGGTESRSLLRVTSPDSLYGAQARDPAWTPDSKAVIVGKSVAAESDRDELWLVPIDGSGPRKLQLNVDHFLGQAGFRLSPDGHHFAFVGQAGAPGGEIRALENVVPGVAVAVKK